MCVTVSATMPFSRHSLHNKASQSGSKQASEQNQRTSERYKPVNSSQTSKHIPINTNTKHICRAKDRARERDGDLFVCLLSIDRILLSGCAANELVCLFSNCDYHHYPCYTITVTAVAAAATTKIFIPRAIRCNVCHFYIYICRFIYSKICFVYNLCVCLCSFLAVTMLCLMARPIWDLFVKNKHIYIFIYIFCSSFEGDNILAKCF